MASDATTHVARSPWWYRERAATIGAVYFSGFFFGPLVMGLAGRQPVPVFMEAAHVCGRGATHVLLLLAIVLTIACWGARVWGGAYLRPEVVWNADALDDRLIVEGPFRYVRNPLYLGNVLLALAMSVFATPLGAIVIVAGNLATIVGLVRVEQRLLRVKYGAAFDAYATSVPAIVPRLRPWNGAEAVVVEPSFRLGLRSELFSGFFVIATVALAIYLW